MAYDNGREIGWDDTIEHDSEFTLLPDGDYEFEVIKFERARHAGSDKIPPCPKAVVHLRFVTPEGSTVIKHNLFLHSRMEGLLCAFFTSIGQRQHGEKIKMNWSKVVGSKGKAKLYVDNWTGNDGKAMQSNKVKRFLDPDDAPAAPATPGGWQPGNF